MPKKRDYKKEYRLYQSSPKQIKDRSKRNQARKMLNPGRGKEVDHIKPLSKGGSNKRSNLRVVLRKTNRRKGNR